MFSFSSCSAYLLLLKGSYRYNKRVCGYDLAKLYNIGEIVVFPESGKHISNDVYEYVNPNTLKEKLTSKSDMNLLLKYTRDFYADGRRVLNYDSTSENKHKICI